MTHRYNPPESLKCARAPCAPQLPGVGNHVWWSASTARRGVKKKKGASWTYEQDDQGKYYLCRASCDHNPTCTRCPDTTAAERRADGDMFVPSALHELAEDTFAAIPSMAFVDQVLREKASKKGLEVTWNWHHLDNFLQKFVGPVAGDARGLVEWLSNLHQCHGMDSFYDTDNTGRLTKVYYECEGARDHIRASEGARKVLYDTTHGTNRYGMKLGCFTGVDNNGKTILLAVSLLVNEDTASFKWAFNNFAKSFSFVPDVMFTDGDRAMVAALRVMLPKCVHFLCVWHLSGKGLKSALWRLFPAVRRHKFRRPKNLKTGKT